MNVSAVPASSVLIVKNRTLVIRVPVKIMEFVWTYRKDTKDQRFNVYVLMVSYNYFSI